MNEYETKQFKEIAVAEAACDRRLRGVLEWLLLDDTYEVSQDFLEYADYDDLIDDISRRYQLSRDGALRAVGLCEKEILSRCE